MARPILTVADFALAFSFARSEPANFRDSHGDVQTAAIDVPRFDHDEEGKAIGLLISVGSEPGRRDRAALDPLILPYEVSPSPMFPRPRATVLHHFDGGDGAERRAWYTRDARGTIDALMRQTGHHLSIGVVPGFLPNNLVGYGELPLQRGHVRYRDQDWLLPAILTSESSPLTDGEGHPLIENGA